MSVKTEIINYKNYGKALRITNGTADAVVTLDIGPRVVFWGFTGGTNVMMNQDNFDISKTGPLFDERYYKDATWYIYGGHRLWTSPEHMPGSYYPDNDPVEYTLTDTGAVFTPPPQTANSIQMSFELSMDPVLPKASLNHFVRNIADTEKEFSLWCLSVLAPGGLEIIKQNNVDTGLLHNRAMSLWAYTDMSDPRVFWGRDMISLRQDAAGAPFKLGLNLEHSAIAYQLDDTVFIKRYSPNYPNGVYPDNGMSFETYTNEKFIEMETLSELKTVAPGSTESHAETWELRKNPGPVDARDDKALSGFYDSVTK